MSSRSAENTISGYYYQFDKSILEILSLPNEDDSIVIEGIEDIDVESANEKTAIQCKYHAKVEYNHSKIAKPIRLLLDHYKLVKDGAAEEINYFLYAHFKEGQEKLENELPLTVEVLKEKFLTYKSGSPKIEHKHHDDLGLTDNDLAKFIEKLEIEICAKNIQEQRKEVIEVIRKTFDNCSYPEAENYFYNNALKVVFDKAKESSEDKRRITKKEFCSEINKKAFLFNKWYAHLKGKNKYIEYIKRKLKSKNALSTSKYKYLFIGKEFLTEPDNETSFESLIQNIIEEYFQVGKAYSTKSKVWTIVLDSTKERFAEYKEKLRQKGIRYYANDPDLDSFDINRFNEDPITNTSSDDRIDKASFQIKLILFEEFKKHQKNIENIDVAIFFSKENHEDFFQLSSKENVPISRKGFQLFVIEPIAATEKLPSQKLKTLSDVNSIFDEIISGYDYLRIVTIEPNLVQIEVTKPNKFKNRNDSFSIGSYVRITDENGISIIGMLQSYKIKDANIDTENNRIARKEPSFILDIQPMGYMKGNKFKRGGHQITIPPNEVAVADSALLKQIFSLGHEKEKEKVFSFGTLSNNEEVDVLLEGNQFFNKHIAVVGSTGAGKSCTVAKILQSGIERTQKQKNEDIQNNSRIIIFDLHGEYKEAFPNCKYLSVSELKLPYWLLSGDELTSMFVESNELNSHNQYSQLKYAITVNKQKHNPTKKVDFDTPVYFSLTEVINYISNMNRLTVYEKDGKTLFAILDKEEEYAPEKLWERMNFEKSTGNSRHNIFQAKVSKFGGFNGEFDRFISRLEARKEDERLDFMLGKGENLKTEEFENILKQFLGHKIEANKENSNVVIIDLSGITFDVLNVAVSLISRLIFNFMYHSKQVSSDDEIENPILMVYEEAHNYIPKLSDAKYRTVKESIERIAKEGRKYGISAMIISQRPSEISETIFSQCNTFVVMRLTNPTDQGYIKRLLPDSVNSITDNLSGLEQREALVLGTSIPMPTILRVDEVPESRRPKSDDVNFLEKWKMNWNNIDNIDNIIDGMIESAD